MKQLKQLDRKALKKRTVKVSTMSEALRDATPLVVAAPADNKKLIVKKEPARSPGRVK